MLTLARALGRSPKILLADELSLGLAPLIVERLLSAVRAAADSQGVACLVVEQHVRQALEIADRVYVLQRGRIVMSGTSEEIARDIETVERAYLTGAVDAASAS
jgi:branched-chain amino acid transport system ATP-binding protein